MQEDIIDVTTPVDTKVESKPDRIEVETNIEAPEADNVKQPKVEPKEAPPERTVNPRTEKRKAEKERLIRENAAMKERLRSFEEQPRAKQPDQPEVKQKDFSKEPNIAEYEDVMDYTRDLAKYEATQLFSERDKQQALKLKEDRTRSFVEQLEEVKAEVPDIMERMAAYDDAGLIPEVIGDAMVNSKISGQLAAHFAKFPGDLKQLNTLRPDIVPQAMKQIEAFIKQGGAPVEKPKVTQAKPPIAPPGNNAKTDRSIRSYTQEEIENMPLSEWTSKFGGNSRY